MGKNLLEGKKGIISGVLNDASLAWQIAKVCREEGAELVLTNTSLAMRFSDIRALARSIDAPVVAADMTKESDIDYLIEQSLACFKGPFDFALHSIGMSYNIRKKHSYTTLNHNYMLQTLDVSAVSLHKFLQACFGKDAIKEWGSVIALTFVASQRIFPQYNEMGDAKSLLESIVRSFGLHYGNKKNVRVNAISQSPALTVSGGSIPDVEQFIDYANLLSPLGNASATSLAGVCAALFSDYCRYVTMQTIYNDGGYHATGVTEAFLSGLSDKRKQ